MTCQVNFSPVAEEDLARLLSQACERELTSAAGDLDIPERAIDASGPACSFLRIGPFDYRRVDCSAWVLELVVPFGATGNMAMFESIDARTPVMAAVRHQREADFH